jgi:hypothetical protein
MNGSTNSAGMAMWVPALVLVVAILAPLGLSAVFSGDSTEVFLERPDDRFERCVQPEGKDTMYMRFHHMDFLKEVRDEVLRNGVRGEIGLDRCKDCHTSRERFCDRCHDKVNLTPDCFGCHYYP